MKKITEISKQPVIVLSIGLLLTFILSFLAYSDIQKNVNIRFEASAIIRTKALQNSIDEAENALHSVNDLIVASQPLSAEQFKTFTAGLLDKYKYIKNFSYNEFTESQNPNVINRYPEMTTIYIEPYDLNSELAETKEYNKAFYFNTIKKSKDTAEIAVTDVFEGTESDKKRKLLMMWLPLHKDIFEIQAEALKPKKVLPGFAAATIEVDKFIEYAFQKAGVESGNIEMQIIDDATTETTSIYNTTSYKLQDKSYTSYLKIGDRRWIVKYSPSFQTNYVNYTSVWITLFSGIVISILLTTFLHNRQTLLRKQIIQSETLKKSEEQQELLKQLFEQSERLNNLVEVQSELAQADLDLNKFMHFAADRLMSLTEAEGAMIEIDQGENTLVVAVVGTAAPYFGLKIKKKNSLTGLCLSTKMTQMSNNAFNDPNVDIELAKKMNVQCFIAVPLLHNGEAIGVCKIISSKTNVFTEHDIQTLKLLAHLVGTAIQQRKNTEMMENVVGQLKQTADDLFKEKELAQVTLRAIGDGVIATDIDGNVTYINPVAEELTGWTNEQAQGHSVLEVFKIVNELTHEPVESPILKALNTKMIVDMDPGTILIHTNGVACAVDDSAAPIFDHEGKTIGAVLVFRDVSHERMLAKEISHQAQHDTLTGLLNRREFNKRIEAALHKYVTFQEDSTVLYLDLDQFKIVNDTCGHHAGDELLLQITSLLRHHVRSSDTVARLGGDEFGILLEGCQGEVAYKIAEKLRESVQNYRFPFDGQIFSVGVSIGLVSFSTDDFDLKRLLSAADSACYIAKEKGRNQVCIYQPDAEEQTQRSSQMSWVVRLQKALEENHLVLFAQPIVSVKQDTKEATHYEMLIRMKDEEGKIIPPMAFIPAAERYQMMSTIDKWVLKEAFKFSNKHPDAMCSINLSGQSISDDKFLNFVLREMEHQKVKFSSICFEITETAAIANFNQASQFISELKKLGCRFALDDFGSGMSSFNYLKQLPVDFLKIDGGFVKNMVNNPIDQAMVESINNIGHIMGLKTIAEFVENDEILKKLQSIGVDYAQGYGIGKPMDVDSIGQVVAVHPLDVFTNT